MIADKWLVDVIKQMMRDGKAPDVKSAIKKESSMEEEDSEDLIGGMMEDEEETEYGDEDLLDMAKGKQGINIFIILGK